MQYAYRIHRDVTITCAVYGQDVYKGQLEDNKTRREMTMITLAQRIEELRTCLLYTSGSKILPVPVHIRQDVHVVMLEHLVQLPQVGPALVMEETIAH